VQPDPRSRRRKRRQTLTFVGIFVLVIGIGGFAYAAEQGIVDLPLSSGKPTPKPTCPTPSATAVAPDQVKVQVLNSSQRRGLAYSAARDLQKRGFTVVNLPSNDPDHTKVAGAAVIRYGPKGTLQATTLSKAIRGRVQLVKDTRPGTDVDVLLGQGFALAPIAAAPAAPRPSVRTDCVTAAG
jgi:hypothetical protein